MFELYIINDCVIRVEFSEDSKIVKTTGFLGKPKNIFILPIFPETKKKTKTHSFQSESGRQMNFIR